MMNYSKAIKLLYHVENLEVVQSFWGNTDKLEHELERMAKCKFKFVVSMQQYSKFNKEKHKNAEFLLCAHPNLQLAYLQEEPPGKKEGTPVYFQSSLMDTASSSLIWVDGVQNSELSCRGTDGKPDNQNYAIISFYRGECLQLIDANQENSMRYPTRTRMHSTPRLQALACCYCWCS
jgi:1,3-beta-glucan synthase